MSKPTFIIDEDLEDSIESLCEKGGRDKKIMKYNP